MSVSSSLWSSLNHTHSIEKNSKMNNPNNCNNQGSPLPAWLSDELYSATILVQMYAQQPVTIVIMHDTLTICRHDGQVYQESAMNPVPDPAQFFGIASVPADTSNVTIPT